MAASPPEVGSGKIVGNMTDGRHGGILNIEKAARERGDDCNTQVRIRGRERTFD
jgi:hypothetical protein